VTHYAAHTSLQCEICRGHGCIQYGYSLIVFTTAAADRNGGIDRVRISCPRRFCYSSDTVCTTPDNIIIVCYYAVYPRWTITGRRDNIRVRNSASIFDDRRRVPVALVAACCIVRACVTVLIWRAKQTATESTRLHTLSGPMITTALGNNVTDTTAKWTEDEQRKRHDILLLSYRQ